MPNGTDRFFSRSALPVQPHARPAPPLPQNEQTYDPIKAFGQPPTTHHHRSHVTLDKIGGLDAPHRRQDRSPNPARSRRRHRLRATPGHLAAYAGLAPVTRRSGTSMRGERPPRGDNKQLERALLLTTIAALADPAGRAHYDCKRAEARNTTLPSSASRHRVDVLLVMLRDKALPVQARERSNVHKDVGFNRDSRTDRQCRASGDRTSNEVSSR